MSEKQKAWLKTLAVIALGGGFSAVGGFVVANVKDLKVLGSMFVFGGVGAALGYIRQSPFPKE